MQEIDLNEVAKNYNSTPTIWQEKDEWHTYNFSRMSKFLSRLRQKNSYENKRILNAGSGGQNYNFPENEMYHVDVAEVNIKNKPHYVVGNIESTTLESNFFDLIICVGAVINYCDAFKVIQEFARVSKDGAELVLEYESSKTLELIFRKEFNASSAIVETFFQGKPEKLWYYSDNYIENILNEVGFDILKVERFHFLSILVYRLTKSPNFSSKFACLDKYAKHVPGLRRCASNVIIYARKVT